MTVNFELLLQRSNAVLNKLDELFSNPEEQDLLAKPDANSWSAVEVVEHLNLVYDVYLDNFETKLESCQVLDDEKENQWQRTLLGRMSVYSMKPKGTRRRFKMKTFDFFTPVEGSEKIWPRFQENKKRFNEIIRKCRRLDLKNAKIPTSLGERIRFYIPECIEFLIAHEERHLVQIDEILEGLKAVQAK